MTRRRLLLGAGALFAGAIATPIAMRLLGRKRPRFVYATGELSASRYSSFASKPGWGATTIEVRDGLRLNGLVRRPTAPDAPWVLFYPGNDPAQLETGQCFLESLRGDADWGLALFACRGFDSSPGVPRVDDLRLDAIALHDRLLEDERIPARKLHIAGFSIGGYMAVAAAGASQEPPASLTLLAAVSEIVMVRPSPFQRIAPGDDYLIAPLLRAIKGPTLVLQGGADEALGGPDQGRAIASTLGDRAKYVELAGLPHDLLSKPPAIDEARAFIKLHT